MSDHWKDYLHDDAKKQLEDNEVAARQQAAEAGRALLASEVVNREQQLEAQALRQDSLTPENIGDTINSPIREFLQNC